MIPEFNLNLNPQKQHDAWKRMHISGYNAGASILYEHGTSMSMVLATIVAAPNPAQTLAQATLRPVSPAVATIIRILAAQLLTQALLKYMATALMKIVITWRMKAVVFAHCPRVTGKTILAPGRPALYR